MKMILRLLTRRIKASVELITNGTFSDGLTGWTEIGGPTTFEVTAGELHIIGDAGNAGTYQSVPCTLGTSYTVSFDYRVISGSLRMSYQPYFAAGAVVTGTGTYTLTQNAEVGGTDNMFFRTYLGAGEFYIDNVSFKES